MSLTPYFDAHRIYAVETELDRRFEVSAEEEVTVSYHVAKLDYQLTHHQLSARGLSTTAAERAAHDALYDLSTYTSAQLYSCSCAIDQERTRSAEQRRTEELRLLAAGAVPPPSRWPQAREVAALLLPRLVADRADLMDMEHTAFVAISDQFERSLLGQLRLCRQDEELARTALEEAESREAIWLVATLKGVQRETEVRLVQRGMNTTTRRQVSLKAAQECPDSADAWQRVPLDSMYAVPLWQRVCVIREETVSEEDITRRKLHLTSATQGDLLARHFLVRSTGNGFLKRSEVPLPEYRLDDLRFALYGDRLILEANEEFARMAIIDEAVDSYAALTQSATRRASHQ